LANAAEDLARLEKFMPARFRRSYSYESHLEWLAIGRNPANPSHRS